jgi:dCTP deaminase
MIECFFYLFWRTVMSSTGVGVRPDSWIRSFAEAGGIDPFEPRLVRSVGDKKVVSFGTSSYGYDVRCGREFKIITNINATIIDPKAFDPKSFVTIEEDTCIIPPNGFVLATTIEYFRMPPNVLGICLGKSTYARCGIIVNVTPIEPGFEGHITLELSNTTHLPARVYAHEGIAQIVFLMSDTTCDTNYADRKGKYQGQRGVTLPTL